MKFKYWHCECDDECDAETIEAASVAKVAEGLLFRYYEGDCDSGADDIEPHQHGWIATRKGSPDAYYIKEVPCT